MNRRIIAILGAIIGIGLFWLSLRGIDISEIKASISHIELRVALPVILLVALLDVLEIYLRGLRWKILLSPVSKVKLVDTFRLEASALALNNLLPMRLGEVVRGVWGGSVFNIPLFTVFSTIMVERLMDGVVLTLLFLVSDVFGGSPSGLSIRWLWIIPIFLLLVLVIMTFANRFRSMLPIYRLKDNFPKTIAFANKLSLGAAAFRRLNTAFAALSAAILQWIVNALNIWLIALAFGLNDTVSATRSIGLLFTGAVAVVLPGLPGYFGNFEFAISKALSSWGISPGKSFAYASFSHILSYIVFTFVGLVCLHWHGQSLKDIWKKFSKG